MRTTAPWILTILCIAVASVPALASDAEVTVMTRNLYLGTDLSKVLAARTTSEFLTAVSAAFAEVQATNFPERAQRLAEEIDKSEPELIGLQEVAMWRSQFPADFSPTPNASTIEYDFLEVLLAALDDRGLHYSPVVVGTRADIEAPGLTPVGLKDVRLTMRDVILVRTDSDIEDLRLSNPREHQFERNLVLVTFVGPIVFKRGWATVDVTIEGRTFRFANTHLEAFAEAIRVAQAAELLAGPVNTDLPVILTGDFNAAPGTPTYVLLTAAGFSDAAAEEAEEDGAYTCCQAANLQNDKSNLSVRIDHVLLRGDLSSEDVKLVGHRLRDRTASGLWPSDHAGIVAKLVITP